MKDFVVSIAKKLDWCDLLFWASGISWGIAFILAYDYYDPIANWEMFKGGFMFIWGIIGVTLFYLATEVKD